MRSVTREVLPVAATLSSVPQAGELAHSPQPRTARAATAAEHFVARHAQLTKEQTRTGEQASLHVRKTQVAPFAFGARQTAS